MVEDVYIFKVILRRGLWRRIQISPRHSLHDLHLAILEAYEFGDEHLYAFFMEGKPWQGTAYWGPHNDCGPYAEKTKLESLNLEHKQKFLYLYDFGDEWKFSVQLEAVLTEAPHLVRPIIIAKRGEAPEQY